ncbi:MAG: ABC transporter ATP-binding protein [Oceanospirillales bacterium]|nr:MAG: ABC transporter ATP-binding protein [Oceanospirillales bacterium]
MALISIKELSLDKRLSSVSLDLQEGEVLGLIGPNGAGKTSLLHCLAGIEAYQGEIHLKQQSLKKYSDTERARLLGLLPQGCQSAWSLRVRDVISLGRLPWQDEDHTKILAAAQMTGVDQWLNHAVDQLSGGEQLRVWLARVLAGEPQIVLADEPLASLDLYYQCHVLSLLRDYVKVRPEGKAVRSVMVSLHDLSMAARYCDRLCLLHQGHVWALGRPEEVLTQQNIFDVYQVNSRVDLLADPPVVSVLG